MTSLDSKFQIKRIALQRNDNLRQQFKAEISVFNPNQLVFLDETGIILVILCLSLVSASFQLDSTCGNGFLETGEECDCGSQQDCNRVGNTCCRDCKFVARGTICRDAVNSCDVPEYCNGTSAVCPADLVTANGISCNNDKGYCHEGECRTHSEECNELWNGGAFKADDACYEVFNLRGDKLGYCKKQSETSYLACASENVQCGKLWCIGNSTITPKDRGYNHHSTNGTLNSRRIICQSVAIYQAPGLPELGTVLDGTKCGNEMVCKSNECVSLSVAYGGQRTCPNNCNGNGVCNENGNCHCNPGWKCPDCSEAYNGPGGSSDSGLDCKPVTKPPCQCTHGACCKNCQIVARGTVCRDAVNSCDVPEYCDGTSEVCPADLKTANGISCNNEQGYCHAGECRTYNEQCNDLWFGGAFRADDLCYERINLRGDKHGYCKRHSATLYTACTLENSHCGKLWCTGNGTITAKDFGYGIYWSTGNLNGGQIHCQSAQIYQAPGKPALGTVLDGTKCGSEMVCKDNECVSLSVAYGGQPTCANNCNGNGVCNEKGNCHCNPGWKCPNCAEAYDGPGGSIDNGLSCQVPATTAATATATTPPPTTTTIIPATTTTPPATTATTTPAATKAAAATTAATTTQTEQSSDDKISMKILIPLVIVSLCFLLLLAVSIYCYTNQRRFRQNNNGQPNHKQTHQNETFDSTPEPVEEYYLEPVEEYYSYVNEDTLYETPVEVLQSTWIERNGTESRPQISTGQEPSAYTSLKDNREPASFYQPLQWREGNQRDQYEKAAFVVLPPGNAL